MAATNEGGLNAVLKWGELLDLARGEEHRRALQRSAKATRTSISIATAALAIAIATGIAGIIVQIATA